MAGALMEASPDDIEFKQPAPSTSSGPTRRSADRPMSPGLLRSRRTGAQIRPRTRRRRLLCRACRAARRIIRMAAKFAKSRSIPKPARCGSIASRRGRSRHDHQPDDLRGTNPRRHRPRASARRCSRRVVYDAARPAHDRQLPRLRHAARGRFARLSSSELVEIPAKTNPLGIKGSPSPGRSRRRRRSSMLCSMRLASVGVEHIDMPLTPPRIWEAMREARAKT